MTLDELTQRMSPLEIHLLSMLEIAQELLENGTNPKAVSLSINQAIQPQRIEHILSQGDKERTETVSVKYVQY